MYIVHYFISRDESVYIHWSLVVSKVYVYLAHTTIEYNNESKQIVYITPGLKLL